MTQEQVNSAIRTVLTLLGAFLAGGGLKLFGIVIDTVYWQEISGFVLAGVSIYWSIKSKEVDREKLEGFIRQVITFVGGILMAKNILKAEQLAAILTFIIAILPLLQSYLGKKKSDDLVVGKIAPAQLIKTDSKAKPLI